MIHDSTSILFREAVDTSKLAPFQSMRSGRVVSRKRFTKIVLGSGTSFYDLCIRDVS